MPNRFHLDPDKVRKVEICHQYPGLQDVRVSVEYVSGEERVLTLDKSILARLLQELYTMDSKGEPTG